MTIALQIYFVIGILISGIKQHTIKTILHFHWLGNAKKMVLLINNIKNAQGGTMKKLLFSLILLTSVLAHAQNIQPKEPPKEKCRTVFINAGLGLRYQPYKIGDYDKTLKSYSTRLILNLGLGFYLENKQQNILGVEMFAYQYPATQENTYSQNYGYVFDIYYRCNINLNNHLALFPQIAISPFSSIPAPSFSISLGASYDVGEYEIFVKNCFRYANMAELTPWFFTLGIIIKL